MNITVTLKTPIVVNKVQVSELIFKEADVGDLIAGEIAGKAGGQVAQVAATLASMAGITLPEFRTIKAKDFAAISTATASLLGNGETEDGASG